MSSLNSASTMADVQAAYADNASYAEDGSPAKARAFITACRLLLLKLPKRAGKGGDEIEFDPRLIAEEIAEAKRYLTESNLLTAPPKVFSVENYRD